MIAKLFLFVFVQLWLHLYANSQPNLVLNRDSIITEVDSLYNVAKAFGSEEVLVFYSDGALIGGLVVWKLKESEYGVAYRKLQGEKIKVKKIRNKYLSKYKPFNAYLNSINYVKNDTIEAHYTSHDYNVIWIYDKLNKTDTTLIKSSKLLTNGETPYSKLYFNFLNLYSIFFE